MVSSRAAEELLAIHGSINDPLVEEALGLGTGVDDRFEIVVGLEVGINVLFPVELLDQVIEVVVLGLGGRP